MVEARVIAHPSEQQTQGSMTAELLRPQYQLEFLTPETLTTYAPTLASISEKGLLNSSTEAFLPPSAKDKILDLVHHNFRAELELDLGKVEKWQGFVLKTTDNHVVGFSILGLEDKTVHLLRTIVNPTLPSGEREEITDKILELSIQEARRVHATSLQTITQTGHARAALEKRGWDIYTGIGSKTGTMEFYCSYNLNEPSEPPIPPTEIVLGSNGMKQIKLQEYLGTNTIPITVLEDVQESKERNTRIAAWSKLNNMEEKLYEQTGQHVDKPNTLILVNDVLNSPVVYRDGRYTTDYRGKPESLSEIQQNFKDMISTADQANSDVAHYIVQATTMGYRLDDDGKVTSHTKDIVITLDATKLQLLTTDEGIAQYQQAVQNLQERDILQTAGGFNLLGLHKMGLVRGINLVPLQENDSHDMQLIQEAQNFVVGGWNTKALRELGLFPSS